MPNPKVPSNGSDTPAKKASQFREVVRRFRKNKLAMLGFCIFLVIAFFAIFAGLFGSYEDCTTQVIRDKLQAPSSEHWFGTDELGRDLFLRCIYGARVSLVIGVLASALCFVVGGALGLIAAYNEGWIDNVIMRALDILSSLPTILMAICIVAALGSSIPNLVIALALSRIASFARITRASALSETGREYIEAARAGGTPVTRILIKQIFPNILGSMLVQGTTNVAQMILDVAGMSFIGLGVPSPMPEWGFIISTAKSFMRTSTYLVVLPAVCVVLAALSINMIGDGLRDALDPRLKS